jgi:hypothetical protein
MLELIIRFFVEIKNQIRFFLKYLVYLKVKLTSKRANYLKKKDYKWTFFVFKKFDVVSYQKKILQKKHKRLVKILSYKNHFGFINVNHDIYKYLNEKSLGYLEWYFTKKKKNNIKNRRLKELFLNRNIQKVLSYMKGFNIDAFVKKKNNIDVPVSLFGFILRKYVSEIFFIIYFIILILVLFLSLKYLYTINTFKLNTFQHVQDILMYNHMDIFFNKFNIDLNTYNCVKKKNIHIKYSKTLLVDKKCFFFIDRGPIKFKLKKNAAYSQIQYTKMFSEEMQKAKNTLNLNKNLYYNFNILYSVFFSKSDENIINNKKFFINDSGYMFNTSKFIDWFFFTPERIDQYVDEGRNDDGSFSFSLKNIPSSVQKEISQNALFLNDTNNAIRRNHVYNVFEYNYIKRNFNQKNLKQKYSTFYIPFSFTYGENSNSFVSLSLNKSYDEFRYKSGNKQKLNYTNDKNNIYIREYLSKIQENYSKKTLYIDFMQNSLVIDSFLSSNVQEKITIFERLCNRRFKSFYRIFLLKEGYFNGFVNLFKYFFDNRTIGGWGGSITNNFFFTIKEYSDIKKKKIYKSFFFFNKNYRSQNKYLRYKFSVFLDLYLLKKNSKNNFYNIVDNNEISCYKKPNSRFKNPNDFFLENLVNFSLQYKARSCFSVVDKKNIYRFLYSWNSRKFDKNYISSFIKRLFYTYDDGHHYTVRLGKCRDKFIYLFKYRNKYKAQFPSNTISAKKLSKAVDKVAISHFVYNKDFQTLRNKVTFITQLHNIESPRFGVYETLYTNKNLFYKFLNLNYKVEIPELLIKNYYSSLYQYIVKFDELRFLLNNLDNKENIFNLMCKKFNKPLFLEKFIRLKLNLEFFPFTYRVKELKQDFNLINKFIYKDQMNNPYYEFNHERLKVEDYYAEYVPQYVCGIKYITFLTFIFYVMREFKFDDFENLTLYNYKMFFNEFFYKKYMKNEKINFFNLYQYLQGQIFSIYNFDIVFYEHYSYGINYEFEYGRFFTNRKRKQPDPRYAAIEHLDKTDVFRKIANVIFTKNIVDTKSDAVSLGENIQVFHDEKSKSKILYNMERQKKEGSNVFINDQVYKKDILALYTWLSGVFLFGSTEQQKKMLWFFKGGDELCFFDLMRCNYLLYSKHYNFNDDVEKYTLFDLYDDGPSDENNLDFFYNNFYGKRRFDFGKTFINRCYFSYMSNEIQEVTIQDLYYKYKYKEDCLYSFNSEDIPNCAIKTLRSNYLDVTFVTQNNIFSFDNLINYTDFPNRNRRSFVINMMKFVYLDFKHWFISND